MTITIHVDLVNVVVTGTDPTTIGGSDGTATATANGGSPPFNYSWSQGGTTNMITGLGSGFYAVTTSDANGCSATGNVTLVDPNCTLAISGAQITDVSSPGLADGAIDITLTGGSLPFAYQWSNGATTQDITNVVDGNYTVTVVDNIGCSVSQSFVVNAPLCAEPANLHASIIQEYAAQISWNAVPGAYAYQLRGRRQNGTGYKKTTVLAPATFKNVYGLQAGTTYEVWMRAWCDQQGNLKSPWTPITSFTTLLAPPSANDSSGARLASFGNEVKVYPNPSEGKFELHSPFESGLIELYNSKGQLIHIQLIAGKSAEIEVKNVVPGILYLRVISASGEIQNAKVLIHR